MCPGPEPVVPSEAVSQSENTCLRTHVRIARNRVEERGVAASPPEAPSSSGGLSRSG